MVSLETANRKELLTMAYRWDGVPVIVGCYEAMRPCILPNGAWIYIDSRDLVTTGADTDPTVWISDYHQQG